MSFENLEAEIRKEKRNRPPSRKVRGRKGLGSQPKRREKRIIPKEPKISIEERILREV